MMVAMATDVRVILIKLADRLHNMRTLGALPKQKQLAKSRETLEIYAPLAHRRNRTRSSGSWRTSHSPPCTRASMRRSNNSSPSSARSARPTWRRRGGFLADRAEGGRDRGRRCPAAPALLPQSTYTKMTKKGWRLNEIFDLTAAMRVIVSSVKDCYGAIGVICTRSGRPLPGRFEDFVAMPKANVPGPAHGRGDRPRGQTARRSRSAAEMHKLAEFRDHPRSRHLQREGRGGRNAGAEEE